MEYILRSYYPRARNLMYPLLGFKKNEQFSPRAYLYWNEVGTSISDYELTLLYADVENNNEWNKWEKNMILGRSDLRGCYNVRGGYVYTFDMSKWSDDIDMMLKGKYSRFSNKAKRLIQTYHGEFQMGNSPGRVFHRIFYPERYFEAVAKELNVNEGELRKVGELWDRVDRERETLYIVPADNTESVEINPAFTVN